MDPIPNPLFTRRRRTTTELAGRKEVITQARVLLSGVKRKRPENSRLPTRLCGVGETVLRNEMDGIAQAHGYRTLLVEVHENKSLGVLLVLHLKRLLYELDRRARRDKLRRAGG